MNEPIHHSPKRPTSGAATSATTTSATGTTHNNSHTLTGRTTFGPCVCFRLIDRDTLQLTSIPVTIDVKMGVHPRTHEIVFHPIDYLGRVDFTVTFFNERFKPNTNEWRFV